MLIKIHNSYRKIIAICDNNLIGKTFEQDNKVLDLTTTFFEGEEKNEQETFKIMQQGSMEDATFNIVGKNSIKLALKAGIIKQEGIIKIQDVSVALVLL